MKDPVATTGPAPDGNAEQEVRGAPAVSVEDARKNFGSTVALDGVSLTLAAGERCALVGPSGCGKSTLLRAVAGLGPLDGGRLFIGGECVDDGSRALPPESRRIGLVFQQHALFPHMTVAANVAFGIRNQKRSASDERVTEMLNLVGLGGYANRYPHELSGGERQRVALARALAPAPQLMLFDEPFASLDTNLRGQLRSAVIDALAATQTPAIIVTHDQQEALAVGDRVAVMRSGRLVQIDTPYAVFHRPVDRFVGAFMGEAAFLPLAGTQAAPETSLGTLDAPVDGLDGALAMVRPSDVTFIERSDGTAAIVDAEFQGARWSYRVQVPDGLISVEMSHTTPFEIGQRGDVELLPGHRQVAVRPDR